MTGGTAKGSLLVNEAGQLVTWYVDDESDTGTISKSPDGGVSYDESETSSPFYGYINDIKAAWGSEFSDGNNLGGGLFEVTIPANSAHTATTYEFNLRGEEPVVTPEINDYSS